MGGPRSAPTSLGDLEQGWDRALDATPDADEFCSSTLWSFAAAESFPSAGTPRLFTDGVGFCGLRETELDDGIDALVGLDPIWGFATPCVGPAPAAARALVGLMRELPRTATMIGGQDESSALCASIVHLLEPSHRLLRGPAEIRVRADVGNGFDAWFARRSGRFRQRMRAIEHDCDQRGVKIVDVSADNPDAVIDRILSIEMRSWKGAADTGLASAELAEFYRAMAWRLARRDSLRAFVAADDDGDIGFILGGVRGSTYRGLQLSYAADAADLGVGHLLQLHQLRAVAEEGVTSYDLGMDMEYKRRWADTTHPTVSIIAIAHG